MSNVAFAQEEVIDNTVNTFCGNAVCEQGENPANCSVDCKMGAVGYFLCAFDEDYCASDEKLKQKSLTVLLVLSFLILFIYLKKKRFL